MIESRAVRPVLPALLLAGLCACTNNANQSNIGLVDVQRISTNWPKFQNYQNQLAADAQTIVGLNAFQPQEAEEIETRQREEDDPRRQVHFARDPIGLQDLIGRA